MERQKARTTFFFTPSIGIAWSSRQTHGTIAVSGFHQITFAGFFQITVTGFKPFPVQRFFTKHGWFKTWITFASVA
jgi:hypothetical protein